MKDFSMNEVFQNHLDYAVALIICLFALKSRAAFVLLASGTLWRQRMKEALDVFLHLD